MQQSAISNQQSVSSNVPANKGDITRAKNGSKCAFKALAIRAHAGRMYSKVVSSSEIGWMRVRGNVRGVLEGA